MAWFFKLVPAQAIDIQCFDSLARNMLLSDRRLPGAAKATTEQAINPSETVMNQSARSFTHGVRRTVLAALALMALGTTAAMATPINPSWTYGIYGQFNTSQTQWDKTTNACNINTTIKLQWGQSPSSCNSVSSLVLSPTTGGTPANAPFPTDPYAFKSGSITTDAAAIPTGIFLTHNNQPIPSTSSELTQAEFDTRFYLAPSDAGWSNPATLDFTIQFWETPNGASPCPMGPTGSCGDIFVTLDNVLNVPFTYDGNNYFFSLFPGTSQGGFSTLSTTACAHFGLNPGCKGWLTPENKSTQMFFDVAITAKPIGVPEPGILGMMGLGLLGIGLGGYALRRRKLSVHH